MYDGLPAANVTGIAQTHDGYLWLATQAGLARFDGMQFHLVSIPVGKAQPIIRAMYLDSSENFWVAEPGGTVVRFGVATPHIFTVADGLPSALALQLVETRDKTMWITYEDGSVIRITPKDEVVRITAAEGLNNEGVCSLTLDVHGTLWYSKGLNYGFLQNGKFTQTGVLNERGAQILGARDGGMWFCTSMQVLKMAYNSVPVAVANFPDSSSRMKPSVLFEDFNGKLLIGTYSEGLFQLDHTNLIRIKTSQNKIHSIFRDHEGSIWVGTDGGGLNRVFPKAIELRGRDEGLPFETVRSIAEDQKGDLWIVTQDGSLTHLPEGNWDKCESVENWRGGVAHSVVPDRAGNIWIGTFRRGLYCLKDGSFSHFSSADGLAGKTVRSLLVDSRDDLWIGLESEGIVQRLHKGQFQSFQQPHRTHTIRAMVEDASGQIWMGAQGGQLLRVEGNKLVLINEPPVELQHPVRCMTATSDGSVWIGYADNGICRFKDNKLTHIGLNEGLFNNDVCAMMPDSNGRLWIASDRGIFYVALAQLNQVANGSQPKVDSIIFGRDSGLPPIQAYYGYWPGALTTRQGQILFPTHLGIAVIYPDRFHGNAKPPGVMIQSINIDGTEFAAQTNLSSRVPPNHRRIEIKFTAPSFIAPEQVYFRFRLSGLNEDWSDPDTERSASFGRLPAGDYSFQVTACNNSGVWSESAASLAFTVVPFFWQTWAFRLSAVLTFALAVGMAARYFTMRRVRSLMQGVQRETALQKERARIAQDMHDELGARFTQIALLGDLSEHAKEQHEKLSDYHGQISSIARTGVQSLSEIVWAVNPRNDNIEDLIAYTAQYSRDFLAAAGIDCLLDFPHPLPEGMVSGEIRHNTFLIVKESLNNVVKHAQAKKVEINFALKSGVMCWRISDDGIGFAPLPDTGLANGLRNIRKRSELLAGNATIESVPGKGTCVTVNIPMQA